MSRLSYGVYLIHLIIIQVYFGNMKKPFYLDGWIVVRMSSLSIRVIRKEYAGVQIIATWAMNGGFELRALFSTLGRRQPFTIQVRRI